MKEKVGRVHVGQVSPWTELVRDGSRFDVDPTACKDALAHARVDPTACKDALAHARVDPTACKDALAHAWTPYCWHNGPVARQLGFDFGQGEISEPKNAQLGRFVNLALLNFGGYKIKENRMGTFGYLMPWTLVEDEDAALKAGWKPYHLQRGFELNESTLSAASAINWGNNLVPATTDAERIKDMIAWDAVEKQQMAVGSGMPCVYRTFLITPEVVRNLATVYRTKDALEVALVETARNPQARPRRFPRD